MATETKDTELKQALTKMDRAGAKKAFQDALAADEYDETAPMPATAPDVAALVPANFVSSARQGILGTDSFAVAEALLEEIFVARLTTDPRDILVTCVFCVGLAYTTSGGWAGEYNNLPKPNVLTRFEVSDRKAIKGVDGKPDVTWVAGSNMNAHAAHILGHLMVALAGNSGFLGAMREKIGTIYTGAKQANPRGEIMKATFEAMSTEERAVPGRIKEQTAKLVALVDAAFGEAQGDLENVIVVVHNLSGGVI